MLKFLTEYHWSIMMKVKAIIILLAFTLVVFSPSSLLAQKATDIQTGIKVGIGLAKWTGEDATIRGYWTLEPSYETTAAFGFFFGLSISDLITIQPEVIYLRKGTSYEEGNRRHYYIIDYLDMPILAVFKLARTAKIKPSIYVGPTISVKLNSRWELRPHPSPLAKLDLKNVNFIDFGLTVGGALEFVISRIRMSLDVRITQGFSGITGDESTYPFASIEGLWLGSDQELKNRAIYAMLGIGI